MQRSEEQYLELEKTNNGKSLEQARQEIKELKQSQFEFKNLKRECLKKDTIINNLNKQIDKLRQNNFKILTSSKEQKSVKKIEEIKESNNNQATLKEINRVMSILESENKIGLSELEKLCVIKPKVMKGILNFLTRYNIIKQTIENGRFSKVIIEKI